MILSSIGAFIVLCIALLHAYWGFGGKFLIDKAVPTSDDGMPMFIPGKIATFAVVAALSVLTWAMVSDGVAAKTISGIFALIFFARFVGDFNYAGMFKKHKNSEFARMDTLLYSPLCLFLSVCCLESVS
ncbi:MAG: DUF3995 domain-containing protein [Campylobacterales bacterium]